MKKLLGLIALLAFIAPSFAFAAPFGLIASYRDASDVSTTTTQITPFATSPGSNSLLVLVGNDASSEYRSFNFGSGIGVNTSTNTVYVTPNSIETPDGYLTNTLALLARESEITTFNSEIDGINADISSLDSEVNSLGGSSFNVFAFMQGQATTSLLVATSTFNGFMSSSDKVKIDSINLNAIGKAVEGTTTRSNSFPIFKSVTVGSGVAVFNLTNDGTSGGASLCPNGVIQDSVNATVNDATASYQMAWAFSNSNKTLTVTTNKLTTANILTGLLGQAAGNGSVVKLSVWCY